MGETINFSDLMKLPEVLEQDKYAHGKDPFVVREDALKEVIMDQSEGMEEWQVKVAKVMFLGGKSVQEAAKLVKKRKQTVVEFTKTQPYQTLKDRMELLKAHQDGPSKSMRKHMLWRIAVDNEDEDPKEATKALGEIGKMDDVNQGSGGGFGTINIIINSDVLKRGPLDG